MKVEDNERLTHVGPGTAMGAVLRRYWQPLLLSWELNGDHRGPVRARILGEDLIVFRSPDGGLGAVEAYCAHRRAPLFYGRNEEGGIRCVYHGWKFNHKGACIDLPNVSENGSENDNVRKNVKLTAYPLVEVGGVIWIYMGPDDKIPDLPNYEWVRAPADRKHVSKTFQENNYLQALEGGLDTSHSSFLHNETIGVSTVRNADKAPRLEINNTDYGYNYVSRRNIGDGKEYVRVYQYIMPAQQIRGDIFDDFGKRKEEALISGHIWVPVDDHTTFSWNFLYAADDKVPFTAELAEREEDRGGRGRDSLIPGTFKLKRNLSNDHMIDRELQTRTYTGIKGINTQDIALQEGMGPINDRSREFLVSADRAIVAMRRQLLGAASTVANGGNPPGLDSDATSVIRGYDGVIASGDVAGARSEQSRAFW